MYQKDSLMTLAQLEFCRRYDRRPALSTKTFQQLAELEQTGTTDDKSHPISQIGNILFRHSIEQDVYTISPTKFALFTKQTSARSLYI